MTAEFYANVLVFETIFGRFSLQSARIWFQKPNLHGQGNLLHDGQSQCSNRIYEFPEVGKFKFLMLSSTLQ
jgi:hypothetical protein